MWYLSIPMEFINKGMMDFLAGFQNSNPIILGLIVGIMCAFDMGGPVNKAAYVTGTALLAQGNHLFMAGVSAACIVPPLATGFSVLLSRKYYSQSETSAGLVNFLLGSTHITEGAIPFAAKRPFIIIPILMVGSSIAAILTYILKVEVPAPHGGFIVLPVVTHPIFWVVSIIIGALVAGILMSIEQKKYVTKSNESDEQPKIISTNNLVDSKRVFLNKSFNNKESALEFIAQQSVETNVSDSFNSVFEGLKARESESSTGMENGIAIPHVSDKSISNASLIVIKMDNEIEWPSLDGKPTNFLISILVPENNGEAHLNILANLSRKLMDKEFTNQLISSNSKEEIVNLLSGVNKK